MSIVTKKGDKGRTSLLYGGMVSKDDPRVELNGALDELSSFLGMAKSLIKDKATKKNLEEIQKDLIVINAEIATLPKFLAKLKKRIGRGDVGGLEKDIKTLETKNPVRNLYTPRPEAVLTKNVRISFGHLAFRPKGTSRGLHFSLPGQNIVSSCLHVARTIARRAERRCVTLSKKDLIKNPSILVYLNRLSDFLYLVARRTEER